MLQQFRRILSSTDLVADSLSLRSIPKQKIILKNARHDVYAINYLGDWGTQFATLALYWRIIGEENTRISPEKWAEWTSKQKMKARNLFAEMEHSLLNPEEIRPEAMLLWEEWRQVSMDYLKSFYARFNIEFDEWAFESEQLPESNRLINYLVKEDIAQLTTDKLWTIRENFLAGRPVIRKSDNTSLYLTRDVGAFFNRDRIHKADKYYYVVDSAQFNHFAHLKGIVKVLGDETLSDKIKHLPYGRIIGLSTRYKSYILVNFFREGKNDSVDFLCQRGVKEAKFHIEKSPTKRLNTPEEIDKVSTDLAKSVLIFDIMKRSRASEYTFSFKGAFNLDQNNALLLHEKYSRLNSLQAANPEIMEMINKMDNFDKYSLELTTPAQNLARFLYEFDTVVVGAYEQLEPCIITIYLMKLSNQIGKTLAALKVRGQVEKVALPRLLLFSAAKKVLEDGMKLIGMEPLDKL